MKAVRPPQEDFESLEGNFFRQQDINPPFNSLTIKFNIKIQPVHAYATVCVFNQFMRMQL